MTLTEAVLNAARAERQGEAEKLESAKRLYARVCHRAALQEPADATAVAETAAAMKLLKFDDTDFGRDLAAVATLRPLIEKDWPAVVGRLKSAQAEVNAAFAEVDRTNGFGDHDQNRRMAQINAREAVARRDVAAGHVERTRRSITESWEDQGRYRPAAFYAIPFPQLTTA